MSDGPRTFPEIVEDIKNRIINRMHELEEEEGEVVTVTGIDGIVGEWTDPIAHRDALAWEERQKKGLT